MAIEEIRIRATISGSGFNVSTPYILSFYIRKSRNELSTFNFSAKVNSVSLTSSGGGQVSFTVNGKKIYTGIVLAINSRPCFDDPQYAIVDVSGTDIRKELEYKQYTRRSTDSTSSWALITGVVRKGLKSQKLQYTPRTSLGFGFYLSPDSLKNGGVQNTSMVKDYLNQSSDNSSGTKKDYFEPTTYGYVISAPSE
jgi:hypothetical protein